MSGAEDPPSGRIEPPPAFLSAPAVAAALAALPGARAVGGAVRDALAGRPIADADLAVPLPPEEVARRLREAGLRVHGTGLDHGTLTAVLEGEAVEVTSLRRDVVTDGRRAAVAWTTDWREDAARRDFTLNALSTDAAGRLWDYFGGREDLAAGRVRFVGDPATRLAEDHLRALRFFRFHARYGRGAPDAEALSAVRAAAPLIPRLSAERLWSETKRLLEAPDPLDAVRLMRGTGVLERVLPEAAPPGLDALARLLRLGAPPSPLLRLAALLPEDARAEGLARRLRLSGEEAARLSAWRRERARGRHHPPRPAPPALDDDALRRWLALDGEEAVVSSLWLDEARDGAARGAARARAAALGRPVFPLRGRDALDLGAAPGPEVGRALERVRDWWLSGGGTAGAEACRSRLRAVLSGEDPGSS